MPETTYRVVGGDTLSKLARRFNTSVQAIAQRNGIRNVNLIRIGQTLYIPSGNSPANVSTVETVLPDMSHASSENNGAVGRSETNGGDSRAVVGFVIVVGGLLFFGLVMKIIEQKLEELPAPKKRRAKRRG